MVVVVGAGAAAVQWWWWGPGGVVGGEFCCGPAVSGEFVVGAAGQGEFVDVGVSTFGPVVGVVDFAFVGGDVAAGVGAAAFAGKNV